ncbi:pyridoxamine 5'-phosphate oxidase family protein [Streptomyces odontomachi]|uniref:pyridoxamine 5'-phosphate oxidase family protein n=1 Tax=Streptomyces odontomachi TaxID=2944940 RepID=UPI00210CEF7B|nr:pyridoxamine 5'-phosphate oxidase family protein [Streptomyces sp. ODS25]
MGKTYERIEGRLRSFIEEQPVFFTATAPLTGDGTVNLSPKGVKGSLAVLDEHRLAYLDFAGSNAETIAHLRENGRITLMWCAFQGPPNIVRVHGSGEPVFRDDPRFPELLACFPDVDSTSHGLRAIIVVTAGLIRDTCGYAVPFMAYERERDLHAKRFAREDDASLDAYFHKKDHVETSIDGLPGLPLPLPPSPM